MYPVPAPIRAAVLILSALVLVSAVAGAVAAIWVPTVAGERASWAMFGFEIVTIVAAVLGILLGLGRFTDGPALALACVAGTILLASGFGWQGAGRQLGGVSLTPMLLGRAGIAMTLGLLAAYCVLSRRREAWSLAIRGVLLLAPVVVLMGALVVPRVRAWVEGALGQSPAVQFLAVTVGFLIVTALVSAGGHLLITAFEAGRTEEPTSSRSA